MDGSSTPKIAVVGLGVLFPDARNVDQFWQNILSKKVSIRPLPESLFEAEVFHRPDLLTALHKQDKSITNIAGWIDDLSFDTVRRYRIPPSVAEHMDVNQHAALYTASQALDANPLQGVANERVAVILGNGMVGTRYGDAMFRVQFQLMEHYLRQHPGFQQLPPAQQDEIIADVAAQVLKDTISISEDTAPGVLPNIIAGRIASVYDFHGPSFTVDAACASVLAAVIAGIQGLQLGTYDAAICGGADMPLKQLGFVMFSALNALSPDGSYPFDKRANGFVMSQGSGTVVLKRMEDAERDGDTIYALITGYGQASDGKGKSIAAPNAEWQAHAVELACRMAGYPVDTIEMVEAHGTATRVGDVVEVMGLKQAFQNLGATRQSYCGLTSVKSNIGHLKSAAGIAGLIKAILALHHKTLPPTASFEEINPKLELEGSPFYILDELREWAANSDHPRRANVSSFGFGGADYHLALEEYRPNEHSRPVVAGFTAEPAAAPATRPAQAGGEATGPATSGLVFLAANSAEELDAAAQAFLTAASAHGDLPFPELCLLHGYAAKPSSPARLAILAASPEDLSAKLDLWRQHRSGDQAYDRLKAKGIFSRLGPPVTPAETALLFPGQASQYPYMLAAVHDAYDAVRTWFHKADAFWLRQHGHTVSSLVFPGDGGEDAALERLRQTQNAHPAIFVSSFALYDLLRQHGLAAGFMIGHSLGEITALAAAGMLNFADALQLVDRRGYAFHDASLPDSGQMLSLVGSVEQANQLVAESGCAVTVANINSPSQVVLSGTTPAIGQFQQFLQEKGIKNRLLYVSHAFHSSLLEPVAERFFRQIKDIPFHPSPIRVVMNHRGTYYPTDPAAVAGIPELMHDQLLQPVGFVDGVRRLAADGVRLFVEVGPGSILSSLVRDILPEDDTRVLTANPRGADDLASLQKLWGALFAEGVPVEPLPTPGIRPSQPLQPVAASPGPPSLREAPHSRAAAARPDPTPVPSAAASVVYSGVAVGLPGSFKEMFRDDNFQQLFQGHNLIERLTDAEKQQMVERQITRLVKDQAGPTFQLLTTLDDVIQLAGKLGRIDLVRDYHVDEKMVQDMTTCIAAGVAAGYEALRDAHIPLVQEYARTSTGRLLPQKLALPPAMQDETGVIFANGFPLIDPVIAEVSRYVAYAYGSKTRRELLAFYESIIARVKDYQARKLLTDWYALHYSRLCDNPGEEDVYRFNHRFMTEISAQANNVLATLINARGPNFQLNAACSSTANAITIAEDFLRSGRVRRMIVVGADDPSSATNLPLLGAGFLCTGAATNEADLYKAAVPFDRRRNGMIMGAGAVGIVLETGEAVAERGVVEVCQLLGTHSFNTAGHIAQIDTPTFSRHLESFVGRMEREHGLRRDQIARQAIYISHETYTPPRGGCSQTEVGALKAVFGDHFRQILVGNTKGMTGHTMGASLEDAVAAKALQYGQCPPVVNLAEPDPMLDGLNLWHGGGHDRTLALKMSAGFGSQGHFVLLCKAATGDRRIVDPARHAAWLKSIAPESAAATGLQGRVLVVRDGAAVLPGEPAPAQPAVELAHPAAPPALDSKDLAAQVVALISGLSGYPPEMLEPEMEFHADLGFGAEQQGAIAAGLAGHFGLPADALQLSGATTIGNAIGQVTQAQAARTGPAAAVPASPQPAGPAAPGGIDREAIIADTLKVFAEVTKYADDMLDLDMEMEADLGIDTVKQATILAILGEKYGLERQEGMQLSTYPTIRHIVDLICATAATVAVPAPLEAPAPAAAPAAEPMPAVPQTILEPPVALAAEPALVPPAAGLRSPLSRLVVELAAEELGAMELDLKGKSVWVMGDDAGIVEQAAAAFAGREASVHTFVFPATISPAAVEEAFAGFAHGRALDVIVDCTHVGEAVQFESLSLAEAGQLLFRSSTARFVVTKVLSGEGRRPSRIVCLTAVDGYLGLDPQHGHVADPSYGALAGFYKGLRKEWPETSVRIVDFAPEAITQAFDACLSHMLDEIEHAAVGVEIAYPEGRRMVARVVDRELPPVETLSFSERDTFLVTGGGSGIAACILLALAEAYPARLVVLDQVPLPENIADLAGLGEAGLAQVKQDIHQRLQQEHDRITPVMLNREFEQVTRAIAIYQNLQAVRRLDRQVHYIACDVRDHAALRPLLEQARATVGPITAIIHAAGLDRSHLLDQKSVEEFQQVFAVKAEGACNLMDLCREDPLRLVVAFASISGRFGNAAQLDYCAANNFLSYWIRFLGHVHPDLHALSLVWSGWSDTGMAWRNELVRQRSLETGLNLIDVDQGVAAFMEEIVNATGEREVIRHRGLDGFLEPGLASLYLPDYPLIDRVTLQDGANHRAYRMFSVERDALIDQHRLGKVPILAAVAYAELAVEYYAMQAGRQGHYLLQHMTFPNAFKLFREQPRELFVEGQPSGADDTWAIAVKSIFKPATGEQAQVVLHSEVEVSGGRPKEHDLDPQQWANHWDEPISLPAEESLQLLVGAGPEQRIILGPLYNDVLRDPQAKEPVLIYPQGAIYPTYFPREQLTNPRYPLARLLVNPCFLDSIYQACAAHLLVHRQRVYLPWDIGELGILRVPREEGLYRCYTRVVAETANTVAYDVVMVDGDGRACYVARNAAFRLINL